MKLLITGGCGFLGSNLAEEALKKGASLTVLDNLSRTGSALNLKWLKTLGSFDFVESDIRERETVEALVQKIKPDAIFHLAGQVAMTTSISDPRKDFEINVGGSINILESVRHHSPQTVILYSSTNKVYGDFEAGYSETKTRYVDSRFPDGYDESLQLSFQSPYGCSKGAADQYMLDYARVFGLKTAIFRHSSIFGTRQFSSFDQGWLGWFVQQALEIQKNPAREPFTISGTGKQVRDVLFSSDLVRCYFDAYRCIEQAKGQAFNMGGGMKNSLSLLELFEWLEKRLQIKMGFKNLPWRQSDQKIFVADVRKAKKHFGFEPQVPYTTGLESMLEWVKQSA